MNSHHGRTAPVIIVGAQRSGTTLLRLMMNSHRSLAVPFESDFLAPLEGRVSRAPFSSDEDALNAIQDLANEPLTRKGGLIPDPDSILAESPRDYADVLRIVMQQHAQRRGKQYWGIKTPGYNTRLDEVISLLPDARIVHIIRDGRDVAVSYKSLSWGSQNTPRVAQDWRWKVMLGHKAGLMLPDRYHEIRYEDLVSQPAEALAMLCRFLNLPYDSRMLDYHRTAQTEMPQASLRWHNNSIKPPDPTKMLAWRTALPLTDQLLFQEVAGDALSSFGYSLVKQRAPLRLMARRAYYTFLRRW